MVGPQVAGPWEVRAVPGTGESSSLSLGYDSGASGTNDLSGTGQLSADYEYIGYSGTGTFTLSGGTNTVAKWLSLAYWLGSSGTYTISGGTLDVQDGSIVAGLEGTGRFNLNGGVVIANSISIGPTSTFTIDGGTLRTMGSFLLTGNVLIGPGGATIDTQDATDVTWDDLTLQNEPTLTLAGDADGVSVDDLNGNGTIAGGVPLSVRGTVFPGESLGYVNITGPLTMGASSTYACRVGVPVEPLNIHADQVSASGGITLASGSEQQFEIEGLFTAGTYPIGGLTLSSLNIPSRSDF